MQLERELTNKLLANKSEIRHPKVSNPEQTVLRQPMSPPEKVPIKPMRGKYLNNVDEVADII